MLTHIAKACPVNAVYSLDLQLAHNLCSEHDTKTQLALSVGAVTHCRLSHNWIWDAALKTKQEVVRLDDTSCHGCSAVDHALPSKCGVGFRLHVAGYQSP